jgi:hypothetical protein
LWSLQGAVPRSPTDGTAPHFSPPAMRGLGRGSQVWRAPRARTPLFTIAWGFWDSPLASSPSLNPGSASFPSLQVSAVTEHGRRPDPQWDLPMSASAIPGDTTTYLADFYAKCQIAWHPLGLALRWDILLVTHMSGLFDPLLKPAASRFMAKDEVRGEDPAGHLKTIRGVRSPDGPVSLLGQTGHRCRANVRVSSRQSERSPA